MNNEKLLKTGQVAEMLNVPQRTIQDWTKKGFLVPEQISDSGYNFYSFQQIIDFSKTAQNLLPKFQNHAKSPTIKKQTAQNLQKCLKNSSIKSMYIKLHFDEQLSSQKIVKVSGKRAIEINNELIRLDKSLPEYHFNEVIKLMSVLKLAELSKEYKTSFKKDKSLQTFFRLDSDLPDDSVHLTPLMPSFSMPYILLSEMVTNFSLLADCYDIFLATSLTIFKKNLLNRLSNALNVYAVPKSPMIYVTLLAM